MSATPSTSPVVPAPTPANASAPVLNYAPAAPKPSDWSPLRNKIFLGLWLASAVSYIGLEIRNFAATLLMIDLVKKFGARPAMVQYTQTATMLPIFLLVLIAGALADVLDRRKLLIFTHIWMMAAAGLLGFLTVMHLMTPWLLLAFLALIGAGFAMMNPVFLAVLPELVQPSELRSALALNSVSLNIARVMGPALGGVIVGLAARFGARGEAGFGDAFLATAISVLGVIIVVLIWKPTKRLKPGIPETVGGAIRTGFRYAWFSPHLRGILFRIFLFIVCAGVMPVFAPVIGKKDLHLTAQGVGGMMAFLGVGALFGVYFMQPLQRKVGIELSVALCTILYGLATIGLAFAHVFWFAAAALLVAGFNWVIVPTNFNIATQLAVPAWVKGRAMSMYSLVLYGSFAVGPAIFGPLNDKLGERYALAIAGAGVVVGALAAFRFRLVPKGKEDFTPSKHWPKPVVASEPARDDGPVMVTVEYRIDPARAAEFSAVVHQLKLQRLRGGASHWGLYDAAATPGRYIETFIVRSWSDHLRQHDRMTKGDAAVEETARSFHLGSEPPVMSHWLHAPPPSNGSEASEIVEPVDWEERAAAFFRGIPMPKALRARLIEAWAVHEERLRMRELRP